MFKDFKKWSPVKEEIDFSRKRPFFFEREICWCNLGVNVGYEQDGKGEESTRPVLVYKKHNSVIFTAIPLSTKIKEGNPFYFKFTFQGKEQSAIIIQSRALDSKRLLRKIGEVPPNKFRTIKAKFLEVFG